jgi:uncharacterized protein (UPF0210 family)
MLCLGRHLLWSLLLAVASAATAQTQDFTKPKVGAITGFVRLDRDHYTQQIAETLAVLRAAKGEFEKQGYEVQTLRIVTQPLGDLVSGQSDTDALAFLKALDDLSVKEDFMTAALIITTAVKAVPVKQIGYSGLMVPVMEDKRLAQRWAEGTYNIDSLLAYSALCGTGLDTVPLAGNVSEEQLARIFGDAASLAWKWNKPLSARLQPVKGKKAADQTEFSDQYLFNTTVHALP